MVFFRFLRKCRIISVFILFLLDFSMNPFAQALSAALEYAIVSRQVLDDGAAIGFLYREAAVFEQDSGWRIFSGAEDDEFADNTDNFDTVLLSTILDNHPEITPLMGNTEGAWEWDDETEQFVAVADWSPQD